MQNFARPFDPLYPAVVIDYLARSLPLFNSLEVTEYGLYPGQNPARPRMELKFKPGLTLVLGANGLGKTTLVTMLYRMLTGPWDIPVLARGRVLGTANLEPRSLRGKNRRVFASRVADDATKSSARLAFVLNGENIVVERNLRDLTLRSFTVGGSASSQDEMEYQDAVVRLANVATFGDWILLLNYIVFYFEDRRSLVWDPSAQRQILRILFLDPDHAQMWTVREREILEMDTRARNMSAVATGEERHLARDESRAVSEPEIRDELRALELNQQIATQSLEEFTSALSDITARHENAQLRFFTLQQERESQYRELENAQLLAINARLPQHSDSARYILAQLLTDATCLVCGNHVPSFMESMESRIDHGECVVCGAAVSPLDTRISVKLLDDNIKHRSKGLENLNAELEGARRNLEDSEGERTEAITHIRNLQAAIAEGTARADFLIDQLPPDAKELRDRRQDLASIRARIAILRHDLDRKWTSFRSFIGKANAGVEVQASRIQSAFNDYAQEFLFEDCRLMWSPKPAQLGQTGPRFIFPAFELELGGSNFSGTVRRGGPDDVSQSQKEFIDISFRMALAKVATYCAATSLVMDAPETSLDAVFVDRAARILGTLGRPEAGNRLILTLNIVLGKMIPSLLSQAGVDGDYDERVVDLLSIAAPTAAVRSLRGEYEEARDSLLSL